MNAAPPVREAAFLAGGAAGGRSSGLLPAAGFLMSMKTVKSLRGTFELDRR